MYGPTKSAALIFADHAGQIMRETGIDVFKQKEALETDWPIIQRLIAKWRKEKRFTDEFLDEVWQEQLRWRGILTTEEQHEKDEHSLSKARAAKEDLRESGTADAARFGYCKRLGCESRKVQRLLLRGFCPDCRGVKVKQTIATGGCFNELAVPHLLDGTTSELQTTLTVSANKKKVHPAVLKLTNEERRDMVLAARKDNPEASQREIAALTEVSQKQVSRILKTRSVKTKPENTNEVNQFLRERAEKQPILKRHAKQYLVTRANRQSGPTSKVRTTDAPALLPPCA